MKLIGGLILLFLVFQIVYVVIILVFMLKTKDEIICKYITHSQGETIEIINKEAIKDINFNVIINKDIKEENIFKYTFEKAGEQTVIFKFKKDVKSLGNLFNNIDKMIEIDLSKINPDAYSNISGLFSDCESLQKIDFGIYIKNITYMDEVFTGCNSLKELNLSTFITEYAKSMERLFTGCHSLKSIDLSSFNTKNIINMENLFDGCRELENIDLSKFNFENVEDMSYMFSDCQKLNGIDFGNTKTYNLKRMIGIFMDCKSLKSLNFLILKI